ncbi:unnamed protein product, partial [Oppiella nova]
WSLRVSVTAVTIGRRSLGTGLQRRPNKDKKSHPNKGTPVVHNSSANDSNQTNHSSDKLKADLKLQPTAEQMRIATLMNDKMDDNDLKAKIEQIMELTGSSRDDAVVALHDCDNDTNKAIDMILELEGDSLDSQWMSTGKKKKPPKSTSNASNDDNLKADSHRDSKGDHSRDGKHLSSKTNARLQSRGGGPPRLQRAGMSNRGAPRKPKDSNRGLSEKSDNPEEGSFKPLDPSAPSRRGDRRGRGRGGSGRGNRGGISSGAGRGARTFQNRGIQGNDGFPNSIDTWTNSTADQSTRKPADVTPMPVGNWSDIATNEDWSEEDWEPNHMETKVFTPSTKISEKEEMNVRDSISSNLTNSQTNNLSQFMSKSSVDSNQSMSAILSSNVSRNANVAAGQTLLQQIQQSNAGQTPNLNQYSMSYNKQATESIKSLVGLSPSANYSTNASDLLSNSERDLDSLTSSQPSSLANKTSRIKQTRPSKIPESAVEMPSNDTIAALGVHFGTLEFGSESNQFSLGTDFSDTVSHVNKAKKAETNSLPNSSMLSQSSDTTFRPSTTINDSNSKGVSPIIQNSVLGHQSLASDSLLDRSTKSSVGQFAQKVLERNNKSDYSSVPSQQTVSAADITSNYKNTYPSDTSYNSNNYSTTTSSSYPYSSSSQSAYGNQVTGNYSTNYSGTTIGNTSNHKLRDMDSNSQQKPYDVSNNSVGGLGMNSTVTTNVLKNTLSATGKGVHNVPPGVPATPVLSTPYIVQNPGVPIYPMGIPYDLQFQTTARDHNFGPYGTQDVKYGRGSETEVNPVSTSQTGVSQTHNQTFVNTFPPGYGFYLAPGINMMPQSIYPTQPLYPVAQPQNTGSAGSAFAKANTSYGSHSYNSGYDSISAQTQDYVKQSYPQSVQQHSKGISGSNTSDLTSANSSIYGKNHSQINKSYDKQGFQTATPAFNLTAGSQSTGSMSSTYGAPYVLPHSQQAMSLHTMSSLQTDVSQSSGPGVGGQRGLSQSHKNSGSGANSSLRLDLKCYPPEQIRNFCIIAHINHGKSTLSDRLLEVTKTISKDLNVNQYLDKLEVERERGITVKAQTCSMVWNYDNTSYLLNLIDTPGHVDFSYEVWRSVAACEGAVILVDANSGVQAQTIAHFNHALLSELTIIPVLNKIDLKNADPESVALQMNKLFDIEDKDILKVSAKQGSGVEKLLNELVERIPPPRGHSDYPLKALVFDLWHQKFKGIILLIRIIDGCLRIGDEITLLSTNKTHTIRKISILYPDELPTDSLFAGQVGVIEANIHDHNDVNIGDIIVQKDDNQTKIQNAVKVPDIPKAIPMVFASVYPCVGRQLLLPQLNRFLSVGRDPLPKAIPLSLYHIELDLFYEKCGFWVYFIWRSSVKDLTTSSHNSAECPIQGLYCAGDYLNDVINICLNRRGIQTNSYYIDNTRLLIQFKFPLSEIIIDFYDELKSVTSGYASFDYEDSGYESTKLVKLDILLNDKPVDELSHLVNHKRARAYGKTMCAKLKECLHQQQFKIKIQASVGGKIIAREDIKAFRKDVTAKLYGGDDTRRQKLLKRQAEGKRRLRRIGNIEISAETLINVFKK